MRELLGFHGQLSRELGELSRARSVLRARRLLGERHHLLYGRVQIVIHQHIVEHPAGGCVRFGGPHLADRDREAFPQLLPPTPSAVPRNRSISVVGDGGNTNRLRDVGNGYRSRTCRAPCTSMSSTTWRSPRSTRSTSDWSVP